MKNLVLSLLLLPVVSHAGNPFDKFLNWASSGARAVQAGFNQSNPNVEALKCVSALVQIAVALQDKPPSEKEARTTFLDSIESPADRVVAKQTLQNFMKSENSDELDIYYFQQFLKVTFKNVTGTSFRKLASYFLVRSYFFKTATDVNRTIELLAKEAPSRGLSSNDIARLQKAMIRSVNSFSKSSSVLKGFEHIFGDWAVGMSSDLFYDVAVATAIEIKTFKDSSHQEAAVMIIWQYASKLKPALDLQKLWAAFNNS